MNARIDALRSKLDADEVEAFVVSSGTNIRYLVGFTGDSTVLVLSRDRLLAISDFRYEEQLVRECPGLELCIRPVERSLWQEVARVIQLLGYSAVAFEANSLTVADQLAFRDALPAVELTGVVGRTEALRAIKDDGEIATIREAIRSAERAYTMLQNGLNRRETELQTADLLEAYLKRCGSSKPPFDPIVAAGEWSALPHATPRPDVCMSTSPFALVDWGATVRGYRSDLTRMMVAGNVGAEFHRAYSAVLVAQERAIAAIRPGVSAREVDAVARATIADAGFGGLFGHGLGHGIGLAIHEAPSVRPDSEDVLAAGMVVTVEPGIYRTGWGGIRIEDDVLVTPDGYEVLSHLPKSLDSLLIP